jgi:hypothetical protein
MSELSCTTEGLQWVNFCLPAIKLLTGSNAKYSSHTLASLMIARYRREAGVQRNLYGALADCMRSSGTLGLCVLAFSERRLFIMVSAMRRNQRHLRSNDRTSLSTSSVLAKKSSRYFFPDSIFFSGRPGSCVSTPGMSPLRPAMVSIASVIAPLEMQ